MRAAHRLNRLAEKLLLCQIHLTRLVCCSCDVAWTGTEQQFWELGELLKRLSPYWPAAIPTGYFCQVHRGENLYCPSCTEAHDGHLPMPEDVMNEAEIVRYDELLLMMVIDGSPCTR